MSVVEYSVNINCCDCDFNVVHIWSMFIFEVFDLFRLRVVIGETEFVSKFGRISVENAGRNTGRVIPVLILDSLNSYRRLTKMVVIRYFVGVILYLI